MGDGDEVSLSSGEALAVFNQINWRKLMTETLSVRLDSGVRKRLANLAAQSKRSESFLAAKAIAAYVETDEWQRQEIAAGIRDLDAGRTVPHEQVVQALREWGKTRKSKR
jgi:predicted transcriptional regulator